MSASSTASSFLGGAQPEGLTRRREGAKKAHTKARRHEGFVKEFLLFFSCVESLAVAAQPFLPGFACAFAAMLACASTFAAEPAPQTINLAAVMRLAGANNLDIRLAEQRLLEAEAAHEQAIEQFFPYLTPGASFARHEGNIQAVDGTIIDTNKQSLAAGATVTAQVELGEAIYKTLIARSLAAAAQFAAEAQRQESVYQAMAAYLELLRARAARGVAGESVRIASSYAGEVGRAVEAGLAFRGDAFRGQAQAERNRMTLRQAEEQQRLAAARLAQLLHLSPAVELVPDRGEPAPLHWSDARAPLASFVGTALVQRPELHQSASELAAARRALERAKYAPLFPSVRGAYSYGDLGGGTYADGLHHFRDSTDYGVGLGWRIGPGGLLDGARVRGEQARLQSGVLEEDKLRDEITRQVVEAYTRVHSLSDQIGFARRAMTAAEQTLKLARGRQEFGVGEVLENIQAEQDLTRSRLDYLTSVTEYNRHQLALQRATGARLGGGK